jgi:hypothetical protein
MGKYMRLVAKIFVLIFGSYLPYAVALELKTVATQVTHEFFPGDGGLYSSDYALDWVAGEVHGAASLPGFTADLSTVGSISFTLSAPAGKYFSANGNDGIGLIFKPNILWVNSYSAFPFPETAFATSVSFVDLTGRSYDSITNGFSTFNNSSSLILSAGVWWLSGGGTRDISFQSVTFTANFESLSGGAGGVRPYDPFNQGLAGVYFQNVYGVSLGQDRGQFVTLESFPIAVPTPATIALLSLGFVGFSTVRRKHA